MTSSVLVYDGECPSCSAAAVALERLDGVDAIPWDDDAVGPFLDAQFGERPFAMFLVDPGERRVYAGRSAAEELATRAGTPDVVGSLLRENYGRLASSVGAVTDRDRDVADYHGSYELATDADELVEDLRSAAEEGAPAVMDAAGDVGHEGNHASDEGSLK